MTLPSPLSSCPTCGASASGDFCSGCGTALVDASCGTCATPLTPGARYCHRCGTPAGSTAPSPARGLAGVLPWAVAALAMVSLIALIVGQRFGARESTSPDGTAVLDGANGQGTTVITAPGAASAPAGGMPRAPDISQLTPEQRAERLYDRIMMEAEARRPDNVRTFLPMAIAAYEMLSPLSLDHRYDLGRIGEVGGDTTLARAQADTILQQKPTHLLGLILGARVARLVGNEPHARQFEVRLLSVEARERASRLPEYVLHKNDIDAAIGLARTSSK